jgi:ABC-type sugar transport system ATPase subunit
VLQQCDAPQRLYYHPRNLFVADFIGEPPMNLIPVMLREAEGTTFADGGGWQIALDVDAASHLRRVARSDRVILGFRPEHAEAIDTDASDELPDSLDGRVAWTEMRGDSHVVALAPIRSGANGSAAHGEQQVTIEVPGTSPPDIGAPFRIRVRHDLLNPFDAETGMNLFRRT